jgi:DNA-binding NarL/FixJ family response regulator
MSNKARDNTKVNDKLTPAEERVMHLLATTHLMAKHIAEMLNCTHATIRNHAHAVYRKKGVCSRIELVMQYRAKQSGAQT